MWWISLGLKNAGVNAEMLVEIDKDSCTLSLNFLNSNIICDDIAKIDFTSYKGKIDIVGGFRQAFSYGKSKGFEDTRGTLFFDFARSVKEVNQKLLLVKMLEV